MYACWTRRASEILWPFVMEQPQKRRINHVALHKMARMADLGGGKNVIYLISTWGIAICAYRQHRNKIFLWINVGDVMQALAVFIPPHTLLQPD